MENLDTLTGMTSRYYQRGWTPATSSNFSIYFQDQAQELIQITRSGRNKGMLTPADFMRLQLNGVPIDAGQPSAETELHLLIYQTFSTVKAVLHTHSPAATVLSMVEQSNSITFADYEILKAFPGIETHAAQAQLRIYDNTQDMRALAKQIKPHLMELELPALLIRGHGLYTWGATLAAADRHLEALEFLLECEIIRRQIT